jgi:hypothetical protein
MINGEWRRRGEARGEGMRVSPVCLVYRVCFVPQPNEPNKPKKRDEPNSGRVPGTVAESILSSTVLVSSVLHFLRSLPLDGTGYAEACLKKMDVFRCHIR